MTNIALQEYIDKFIKNRYVVINYYIVSNGRKKLKNIIKNIIKNIKQNIKKHVEYLYNNTDSITKKKLKNILNFIVRNEDIMI